MLKLPSIFILRCLSNERKKALDINTNDLRYQKTEAAIRNAYQTLQDKNSEVKVSDLCQMAMINKSTFYKHYEDMSALEKKVQREYIENILSETPYIHDAFNNTRMFCSSLIDVFNSRRQELNRLFHHNPQAVCSMCEEALVDFYCIKAHRSRQDEVRIRFIIGGACHVLMDPNFDEESYLYQMIEYLISMS